MSEGPRGWGAPLYARVLDRAGVGPGTTLLDLGCGAGEFARATADRGATVTGIDIDPSAVMACAARVPEGNFRTGDAHEPPAGPFDVAAAVQLLAHVTDPVRVLREAARVAPLVVATVWGAEQDCDVRAFGEALAPWLPPRRPPPGPSPLTYPDRLRELVNLAGLATVTLDEVVCPFAYPDADAVLGPLFASGLGRHVANRVGPATVRDAVLARLEPNRTPDGGYVLQNLFRVVVAHAADAHATSGTLVG